MIIMKTEYIKLVEEVLTERRLPTAGDLKRLVSAYAKYKYSNKADIKTQQKLYDTYMKLYNKLSDKYSEYDMLSDRFKSQLDDAADKYWKDKAMKGVGVDF